MKLCAREDCYGEVRGQGKTLYCCNDCRMIVKRERDNAYNAKRRGKVAKVIPGYGFDVGLSRHWLSRAIA